MPRQAEAEREDRLPPVGADHDRSVEATLIAGPAGAIDDDADDPLPVARLTIVRHHRAADRHMVDLAADVNRRLQQNRIELAADDGTALQRVRVAADDFDAAFAADDHPVDR